MPDNDDQPISHPEAEAAYQANLSAARQRLAKIEASLQQPQQASPAPVQSQPVAPTPTPVPSGFNLQNLKNPAPGEAPSATPTPSVDAIIAAHKSVSPLSDSAPIARAQNPLTKHEPATAEHLEPIKTPPAPRSLPSRLKPLASAVIVFFLVLAAFKEPIFYYQIRYLFETPKTTSQSATNGSQVATTPTLTIPKINVSAPVVFEPSIAEAAVQKALESGVVHYGNTANPGQAGNAVLFGHSSNDWDKPGNYKFIFVLLEKLAVGDTYTIDYKGTRYEYQIYERSIILATDVHVVAPTSDPTSTLITCWPTGTSQKRLIVRGKQISPQPSKTAGTQSQATTNQINTVLPGGDSNNGIVGTVTTWIENIRSALKGETIQVNND